MREALGPGSAFAIVGAEVVMSIRSRASSIVIAVSLGSIALASGPSDPAASGAFAVERATIGGLDARLPKGAARALGVLVLHGWGMSADDYAWIADHLATRGIAAALFQNDDAWDLDPTHWTAKARVALDALAASPRIDRARLGVIGHSLGGATTIMTAAADARVKAAVALAPGTHLLYRDLLLERARSVRAPLLVESASLDEIATTAMFAEPIFDAAPARAKLRIEIARGNHLDFSSRGFAPWIPTLFGPIELTISKEEQQRVASRYFTAWLERFLGVAGDASGLTDGTRARADAKSGALASFAGGAAPTRGLSGALGPR